MCPLARFGSASLLRRFPARMACGLGLAAQPRDGRDYARVRALRANAARTRHRRAEKHRGRWYFRCLYAEQHKPALAGEPIKSSQANAGGEQVNAACAQARGKPSSRSKTLHPSPACCGENPSAGADAFQPRASHRLRQLQKPLHTTHSSVKPATIPLHHF